MYVMRWQQSHDVGLGQLLQYNHGVLLDIGAVAAVYVENLGHEALEQ